MGPAREGRSQPAPPRGRRSGTTASRAAELLLPALRRTCRHHAKTRVAHAHALEGEPEVVAAIHRDYAAAGATVHTTNTFRTRPAVFPEAWEELARRAVRLAREAIPADHRVAGSIAPLEDCYSPELSPANDDPEAARDQHRRLARALAHMSVNSKGLR